MNRPTRWLLATISLVALIGLAAWLVLLPPERATGVTEANSRPAPTLAPGAATAPPRLRRVLIIGGTRGIGLATARLALARGHLVTVMSRQGQSELPPSDRLRMLKGDIRDPAAVAAAVRDQDVVVSVISAPPSRSPITVFSDGARNVTGAMQAAGVQRLLVVTGIGAGDSRGHGGIGYDRILQPLLLARIYDDKDREEALVRGSDRDWTLVRPGFLHDAKSTAGYRVIGDLTGVQSGSIARADVAHYLVAALEQLLDSRRVVFLSD